MQMGSTLISILFICFIKNPNDFIIQWVNDFFYKHSSTGGRTLLQIDLKKWHPKLLSTINENVKLFFSVKYNTQTWWRVATTFDLSRTRPNIEFFQIQKCLFYWMKFVKFIKLFEIRDLSCYVINIAYI